MASIEKHAWQETLQETLAKIALKTPKGLAYFLRETNKNLVRTIRNSPEDRLRMYLNYAKKMSETILDGEDAEHVRWLMLIGGSCIYEPLAETFYTANVDVTSQVNSLETYLAYIQKNKTLTGRKE